jgi:N-acetylmuramoyl-L-alanine amidase
MYPQGLAFDWVYEAVDSVFRSVPLSVGEIMWRMLRTKRTALLLAGTGLLVALAAADAGAADPIVVLSEHGRREILPLVRDGDELAPLSDLLAGLEVAVETDPVAGTGTLRHEAREVTLYRDKSLAAVGDDLRLMPAPARLEQGRWLVSVEGMARLLDPLLGVPVSWRPDTRTLVLGPVDVPRLRVRASLEGDVCRVVFEGRRGMTFRAFQESDRIRVVVPADALDVDVLTPDPEGRIADRIRFLGGRENTFAVSLGPRFRELRAFERPGRLVLELRGAPRPTEPVAAAPLVQTGPEPEQPPIVVIDPGHGGEEVGAKGPGGAFEKDVVLAISRRLRNALVTRVGWEVFLTRDDDSEVALDDRAPIANNYKADVFVSIHANASRSHGAKGSEVYFLSYQASDDESRRLAQVEGGIFEEDIPVVGSDLEFILWDMAQAEYLEESSALASRIQEELAAVTGSEGRGIKQAPFRVLVGAAMPAVLVELAFISNPDEEKLLVSPEYQERLALALMRGVKRYLDTRPSEAPGLGAGF